MAICHFSVKGLHPLKFYQAPEGEVCDYRGITRLDISRAFLTADAEFRCSPG